MQRDIHSSIGVGRFDRRLRPYGHHPPLKCPRCDSLNTKFCYYNNYNLSQPRHFCKSCRRYWTKGGVLRNVPVGGGCRKTKRSKPKSDRNSNRSSSSDSSTLTAAANTAAAREDVGAPDQSAAALNFTDQSAPAFNFNTPQESDGGQMFESFTSLMTSQEMLGFRGSDVCGGEEELAAAMNWGDGGVGCGGGGDEGLFDLTGRVESGSYWSRSEWTENDQSLNDNDYLP